MKLQTIENKIYEVRGENVMFDFDLAAIYGVETRVLKQAVRRNRERFPVDFMFEITKDEFESLRSQSVMSNTHGGTRYMPFAFTEQGVAMLSGVLKSKTAIEVNLSIMRAFVTIRKFALSHKELSKKLLELEQKYDKQFTDVYDALTYLIQKNEMEKNQQARRKIGYK